jgi:indoleamine 2,3-dioxygenase
MSQEAYNLCDFNVDPQTGFMTPQPPLARLPAPWTLWEAILDDAQQENLQVGNKAGILEVERVKSKVWRRRVSEVSPSKL